MSRSLEAYREAFAFDIPDDTVARRWLVGFLVAGSVTVSDCCGILTWVPESQWAAALTLPIGTYARFGDHVFCRLVNAE